MDTFLVILHDAVDGSDSGRSELRQKFRDKFHLSDETLVRMFEDLPIILKRGVSKEKVDKYSKALEAMGAFVEVLREEPLSFTSSAAESEQAASPKFNPSLLKDYNIALDPTSTSTQQRAIPQEEVTSKSAPLKKQLPKTSPSELDFSLNFGEGRPLPSVKGGNEVAPSQDANSDLEPSALTSFEVAEPKPETPPVLQQQQLNVEAPPQVEQSVAGQKAQEAPPPNEKVFRQANSVIETEFPQVSPSSDSIDSAAFENPQAENSADEIEEYRLNKRRVIFAVALLVTLIGYALIPRKPSYDESNDTKKQSRLVSKLLEEQRAIRGEKKTKAAVAPLFLNGIWVGTSENDGYKSEAQVLFSEDKPTEVVLVITGAEPQKRTPEEIIKGLGQKFWLERFTLESKSVTAQQSENDNSNLRPSQYKFTENGKAYLRENLAGATKSTRVVVKSEVVIDINRPDKTAVLSWSISNGDQSSLKYPVERQSDGKFIILLSGETPIHAP